jgi:hypothetical protein
MAWSKRPHPLIDLFAECAPDDWRVQRRRMFGPPPKERKPKKA